MITRKLLTILLVIFFVAPLYAKQHTGTLQQIKKTGQIRVGYRTSEPPMSFMDKAGNPSGYTIDIGKYITDEVKKKIGTDVKVVYIPVTSKNRFKALMNNKIDILCGSTTKTLSRMELVDFTQLTFVTGASLMTLRDKNSLADSGFAGKKIGVVKETTTSVELKNLLQETSTEAEIVLFKSAKEGVAALLNKDIDAFSADQIVLIGLVLASDTPMKFFVNSNVYSYEPFALAVRRNDADFRLLADRVLSDLYRSKKIIEIYNEWIGKFIGKRSSLFDAMIKLNSIHD